MVRILNDWNHGSVSVRRPSRHTIANIASNGGNIKIVNKNDRLGLT
jgi:hypothetical protein